jgi:hypothetical protein
MSTLGFQLGKHVPLLMTRSLVMALVDMVVGGGWGLVTCIEANW